MFQFRVTNLVCCRFAQQASYIAPTPHIGLSVRGLRWHRSMGVIRERIGPALTITPAGYSCEFEYGSDRENWVVFLQTDAIRAGEAPGMVEIETDVGWCRLPMWTPLSEEHVAGWQNEFARLKELMADPSPMAQLRIQTGVANILRFLCDNRRDCIGKNPAEQFKALLDEDVSCERSLSEYSWELEFSTDHLRRLFEKEYGITPVAYRNRRRAELANLLLANSRLRVKEVAQKLGFKNPGQFAVFFRQHFKISPAEAIRQYRFGEQAGRGGTLPVPPSDKRLALPPDPCAEFF